MKPPRQLDTAPASLALTLTPDGTATERVTAAIRGACAKIAPAWPLDRFVAVNPFMGMQDRGFEWVTARLADAAGADTTMPTSFYVEAWRRGEIRDAEIQVELDRDVETTSVDSFIRRVVARTQSSASPERRKPTVRLFAEVAGASAGWDIAGALRERLSSWASSYFDEGWATWRPELGEEGPYRAWHTETSIDRTMDSLGLRGFRRAVESLPMEPLATATAAVARLGIPPVALDLYLHALLLRVGGWSSFAARIDWESRRDGNGESDVLLELCCILLANEAAVLEVLGTGPVLERWREAAEATCARAAATRPPQELVDRLVLHRAFERSRQRALVDRAAQPVPKRARRARPQAQAAFCIDVRSEVLRRHLEACDAGIETLGVAGFFGMPIEHVPFGQRDGDAHCPALISPAHRIVQSMDEPSAESAELSRRRTAGTVEQALSAFKSGAVSCFGFVSPLGLGYLSKLLRASFAGARSKPTTATAWSRAKTPLRPRIDTPLTGEEPSGLPLDVQTSLASGLLRSMSLTDRFARLVVLAGHASSSVNNPHASGLDCGACGGRSGEPNARVACAVLNDPRVRARLAKDGIAIPDDTVFVAALHNTTTDDVSLFDVDSVPESHADELRRLAEHLDRAAAGARRERAKRLGLESARDVDRAVCTRAADWAQTRPEWGLAGCSSFVIAPRRRTEGLTLTGRSFLHSYDWRADDGFAVLEGIMTAPMVVASWISMQYFASTVDNETFGAGNKTLHNVAGGVGVFEGAGGDLRVGLPRQSIHDGRQLQHEPVRLNVVIEAPIDAMNAIIERHEAVRQLVDNRWVHLLAMNEEGRIDHRYEGGLRWARLATSRASSAPTDGRRGAEADVRPYESDSPERTCA